MTFAFTAIIELGLIYALVALAVYLTFRILNFPDLTVEGSFPLGACVAAALISQGFSPIIATLLAIIAGFIAGAATACLHLYLRLIGLLASIITVSCIYSINIRIMGKPNIALLSEITLFTNCIPIIVLTLIVITVFFTFWFFLISEKGLAIRMVGSNDKIATIYGLNRNKTVFLLIATSNAIAALAGALFCQLQNFADVSLGIGTIINGLAALLIGEVLLIKRRVSFDLLGCLVGAILYRLMIAVALNSQTIGFKPSDFTLITALLIVIFIACSSLRKNYWITHD